MNIHVLQDVSLLRCRVEWEEQSDAPCLIDLRGPAGATREVSLKK